MLMATNGIVVIIFNSFVLCITKRFVYVQVNEPLALVLCITLYLIMI